VASMLVELLRRYSATSQSPSLNAARTEGSIN
jgi:hypothetical protein